MGTISKTIGTALISAQCAFLLSIFTSFITYTTTMMAIIQIYFLSKLAMSELGALWQYSFCGSNPFIG